MHPLLAHVDARLRSQLDEELTRRAGEQGDGLPRGMRLVLAGHRAAGKSTLLPHVAAALGGLPAFDLDVEVERRAGRSIAEWFLADEAGFREAERNAFRQLPPACVVAVGGGFLSLHASLLRASVTVEVPITFDTYCERLKADPSRPRLRPELTLREELREVFGERERAHAAARPMRFVDFLLALERPRRACRVVTLPPHEPVVPFAWRAKHEGADFLEVRTDLHPPELDVLAASRALPLLIAERGAPIPAAWAARASLVDRDVAKAAKSESPGSIAALGRGASHDESRQAPAGGTIPARMPADGDVNGALSATAHPAQPLEAARTFGADVLRESRAWEPSSPETLSSLHLAEAQGAGAFSFWREAVRVKHVEPLGASSTFGRLLGLQEQLGASLGAGNVTVLATGALALPFRAVLAERNAFDYLALSPTWTAAPGQRLLADAVRSTRRSRRSGMTERLGIIGGSVMHSRSPRIHEQPFDRIELPTDTDVPELLRALLPHYRGLAVTNPFKQRTGIATSLDAINTLVRRDGVWAGENTDVEGALAVWNAVGCPPALTVLGDGGATASIRLALKSVGLTVLTRGQIDERPVSGTVVWTWPHEVEVPPTLCFSKGTRVVVVSYGSAGRAIAQRIERFGGQPVRLGAKWFIAQARRQRVLWSGS